MSIPTGDISSIIAGAAGIIGVGLGSAGSWAINRTSRTDARAERRRAAYADLILAADELTRLLGAHETMKEPWPEGSTVGDNVARAVGGIDRAYTTVLLTGPRKVAEAADQVRLKSWAILLWLQPKQRPTPRGSCDTMAELGELLGECVAASDNFTAVAQKEFRRR